MIQPFTIDDLLRITHLQPDGWQEIEPFFRFYVSVPICRAYKIEEKQGIAAIGAVILHVDTAWLAHIIVAPEMRRKGLGILMTRHLLEVAGQHGRNTQLLIATKMGEPLYAQLGFQRSHDYVFYHRPKAAEAESHDDVRLAGPKDFQQILALDREASGENRGELLNGSFNNAQVVRSGGGIRGYYLPGLGEGLIVALDVEAGQALMKYRLAQADATPVLPAANIAATKYLEEMGIAVKSTAARMVRNGDDPLKPGMLFNRVGGHLG